MRPSFLGELKRRNVLRAGVLYIGVIWALSQGAAQLLPVFDVPNWVVRAFVIAGIVGFPFWLAFAWFYELTPEGIKRESNVPVEASITRGTGRKLDFAIITVLAVAVVLLLTDRMIPRNTVSDKSIAVLPFANTSGDQANDYFSDGLSEELISALSRLANLKVIGRTSSFQFKGKSDNSQVIGTALGVAYLVEGSVRKSADRVRIAVSLLKASDGSTVWGESYDRELRDIFAVQSDIADSVATKMKTTLLIGAAPAVNAARPSNSSVDAYNALLQGNFYFRRRSGENMHRAIGFYKQAIELDPNYALAYANLAFTQILTATTLGSRDDFDMLIADSRRNSARALALNPDLPEAHTALASVRSNADFDLAGSIAESRRAVELAPQDQLALVSLSVRLYMEGRFDESLAMGRRAIASDPLSSTAHYYYSIALIAAGDLDTAESNVRKSMELEPSSSRNYMQLTIVELLRGHPDQALAYAKKESSDDFWATFALALAYAGVGDRVNADASLQKMIEDFSKSGAAQIAMVHAFRKEPDRMFEWLDRAVAQHDPGALLIRSDPFLRAYAGDPRYAALEKRIGLPDLGTKR